jgi:hypothetical protein
VGGKPARRLSGRSRSLELVPRRRSITEQGGAPIAARCGCSCG